MSCFLSRQRGCSKCDFDVVFNDNFSGSDRLVVFLCACLYSETTISKVHDL